MTDGEGAGDFADWRSGDEDSATEEKVVLDAAPSGTNNTSNQQKQQSEEEGEKASSQTKRSRRRRGTRACNEQVKAIDVEQLVAPDRRPDGSTVTTTKTLVDRLDSLPPGVGYGQRKTVIRIGDAEAAFILGRGGRTKLKIGRVSGCRVNLTNNLELELVGDPEARARAELYVRLVLQQRRGQVLIDFDETDRNDLTIIDVPSDSVAFVTGAQGYVLRSIEEEWNTLMFFVQHVREDHRRSKSADSKTLKSKATSTPKTETADKMEETTDNNSNNNDDVKLKLEQDAQGDGTRLRQRKRPSVDNDDETLPPDTETETANVEATETAHTKVEEQPAGDAEQQQQEAEETTTAQQPPIKTEDEEALAATDEMAEGDNKESESAAKDEEPSAAPKDKTAPQSPTDKGEGEASASAVPSETSKTASSTAAQRRNSGSASVVSLSTSGRSLFRVDRSKCACETLLIFGSDRGRRGAELKVMSAAEQKSPGRFAALLSVPDYRSDADGFDTDRVAISRDDFSYVLGKDGSTRRKLTRASHCILECVGHTAFLAGNKEERTRCREYLDWLIRQRMGPIHIPYAGRNDVLTIVAPSSLAKALTNGRDSCVRTSLEGAAGALCILDAEAPNPNEKRIIVLSHSARAREQARRAIYEELDKLPVPVDSEPAAPGTEYIYRRVSEQRRPIAPLPSGGGGGGGLLPPNAPPPSRKSHSQQQMPAGVPRSRYEPRNTLAAISAFGRAKSVPYYHRSPSPPPERYRPRYDDYPDPKRRRRY